MKSRTAVIGVGHLGNYHADKYYKLDNAELVAVCDADLERAQTIAQQYQTEAVADYKALIGKVDAVSIATPTPLHYEISEFFLSQGVHVLVEKPITTTVIEASKLITIAEQKDVVLQVGHIERFNNSVQSLKQLLTTPRFIESIRVAPFQPRGAEVNVVLDLMIHDIDLIHHIAGSPIREIRAVGAKVLTSHLDIANVRLALENGCVANVTASRISASMQRRLRIFQDNAYLSLDLQDKELTIQRRGDGELFPGIPNIESEQHSFEQGDALLSQIESFLDAIQQNKPPVVSGEDGKQALATAVNISEIIHAQLESMAPDTLPDGLSAFA